MFKIPDPTTGGGSSSAKTAGFPAPGFRPQSVDADAALRSADVAIRAADGALRSGGLSMSSAAAMGSQGSLATAGAALPGNPAGASAAVPRPTPLPKRPKGRLFIGSLMIAALALTVFWVWQSFFQYQAYGVVVGRVIHISSAWEGTVRALQVREGDRVRQGQVLAIVQNFEIEQQHARLADELRIAQATLDSELAQLRLDRDQHDDRAQKADAEYYEAWGLLLEEQFKLADLAVEKRRIGEVHAQGAIAESQFDSINLREAGQRAKLEKLLVSVEKLKARSEQFQSAERQGAQQLKPKLACIESLQAELVRLQAKIEQGQICSPVNGRIVRSFRFAGEKAAAGETVLEILEEGSVEAVVYVPQQQAAALAVGDKLDLVIEPAPTAVTCEVTRLGEALELAPDSLQSHYRHQQNLLPVHLRPESRGDSDSTWRIGGEVKLPWLSARSRTKFPAVLPVQTSSRAAEQIPSAQNP